MSETVSRHLDSQAIEAAEYHRKHNQLRPAIKVAEFELGWRTLHPLTPGELTVISQNRDQLLILAGLARIQVDSRKSQANQAKSPAGILTALEPAARTLELIYHHPYARQNLEGVTTDYCGRSHHFLPEMNRDEAKTLLAASPLFPPEQKQTLTITAERLLQQTYNQLPDDHRTKPLIGIELALSQTARGEVGIQRLKTYFNELIKFELIDNPHRVATVASWLIVNGEKLNEPELIEIAQPVFDKLISAYPNWDFMLGSERTKLESQGQRQNWYRQLSPAQANKSQRLFRQLMKSHNT